MISAQLIESETHWLEQVLKFRFHFPDIPLSDVLKSSDPTEKISKIISNSGEREDWISILRPPMHPTGKTASELMNAMDPEDRLILAIGIVHKLLPGFLDRKIHQYFFHLSREPVNIHRTVLGIKMRHESVVPTFTFFTYLFCGNSITERMRIYSRLRKKEFQVLSRELVFPGEREMDEPLFANELVLADEFAFSLL